MGLKVSNFRETEATCLEAKDLDPGLFGYFEIAILLIQIFTRSANC